MHILTNKKRIALSLTFVLAMGLGHLPLAAVKGKKGSNVEVTMADGRVVRGELLAVKSDVLLVYDHNSSQGKSIDLQQVVQVNVLRKGKSLRGLCVGLEVGLGLSLYGFIKSDQHENSGLIFCTVLPVTALLGGILGALAGTPEKFHLAGESFEMVQQDLEELRQYAREPDLEKQDVPH
jgi:small nuclear ribonucleoprotein (snRNP)-like protein